PDAVTRSLAAYVLGQLGTPPAFAAEQGAALEAMAAREREPAVIAAVAYALGHLGEPYGHEWLLSLGEHPEPTVREAAAFALGGRRRADAVAALIGLSADEDPHVRDWATFALGTLAELDTPELRDALAAR